MCHYLNEKIKHEAVDYLHDIALTNVLCLDFLVCGEALPQLLTLRPPTLPIGGLLSLGKTYKGACTGPLSPDTPCCAVLCCAVLCCDVLCCDVR
jgi:hypothetical protein